MCAQIHRFAVSVNCHLPDSAACTDTLQDFEKLYRDDGVLILPDGYTGSGTPTRLVINCHGAGGTVSSADSQIEHQALTQYLVANGYAVMDMNGLPKDLAAEHGIDLRNNVGSPIAVRCYVKGYRYCLEHFHLYPEVFVHGGSMGGITGANLVLCGALPVIAHTAFCPVLDTYHQIFLHPWSDGLPKTALGKLYGLAVDGAGEYLYDEEKIAGYNPVRNKKAEAYPVPLKIWHCVDDETVAFDVSARFVRRVRDSGSYAELRTFPYGGHEPQLVGKPVASPCGNAVFDGHAIPVTPAVEEAFLFIRNFS